MYELRIYSNSSPGPRLISANQGLNLEQHSCFFFSKVFDFHSYCRAYIRQIVDCWNLQKFAFVNIQN